MLEVLLLLCHSILRLVCYSCAALADCLKAYLDRSRSAVVVPRSRRILPRIIETACVAGNFETDAILFEVAQ